jgi:hypothetical protein
MDQLDAVRQRLKCAHIHLKITTYDMDTARLLDLVDEGKINEGAVLSKSMAAVNTMNEHEPLDAYAIMLVLNGNVIQIHFEIA